MEAKKTVVEKYSSEFLEIEKQMQQFKENEIFDFQLLNRIKNLAIRAYYDGMSEGIKDTANIYRN